MQNTCLIKHYPYICKNKYAQDMRQVEFVPFRLTDIVDIYTIRIDNKENTEFKEFMINFKDTEDSYLSNDFNRIIETLNMIINNGSIERLFRPEGKITDRVCALPLYVIDRPKRSCGTLRLYCIRISDRLFIIGGGGKKVTRTYEEDDILSQKVNDLQNIDKALRELETDGIDLYKTINNITINIP